uniref:Sulfotransfer_1 domain-containing protein n=1 Tax=Syphacia muris TaxID=451379 RepID=A0A0N5AS82_9BILA
MPETTSYQLTLEKSPAYFISEKAPKRVYQLNPEMKLIIVVRNPITRAISDYTQATSKRRKRSVLPQFESIAVKNYTSSHKGNKTVINSSWGAIRIGVYHQFVSKWLQYFPLNQIHFVDGERLIRDPTVEIRAAERFLGFEPTVTRSNFAIDPIKGFPCVLKPDKSLHCLGKTKGRTHPNVDPYVLDLLQHYYQSENEKLFQLINRRFNW